MTVRHLLFAGLLVFAGLAPASAQDDDKKPETPEKKDDAKAGEKDKKPERKIDTESPEALALDELLTVPANYGKEDKRVELEYPFDGTGGMDDFEVRGFDKAGLGLGDSSDTLFLAVGSRRQAMLLHALSLQDPYEIEWELQVGAIAADSQLVFVFANGKVGGIMGPYFAKRTKRGYRPLNKVRSFDSSHLAGRRDVKVRYRVEDGEITCWVNGRKLQSTTKLKNKLNGRVGLFASNMNLWVRRLTIKGEIDASKL